MTDRTRSTLRLRLPPTSAPAARPPVQVARPAPLPLPRAVAASFRPGPPAPLDACSRAILEELAGLGLADPPEG